MDESWKHEKLEKNTSESHRTSSLTQENYWETWALNLFVKFPFMKIPCCLFFLGTEYDLLQSFKMVDRRETLPFPV